MSRATLGLALIALALSALKLTFAISGVRYATADDTAIAAALHDPAVGLDSRMHDFRIGRIYSDWKFDAMESIMRVPSDTINAGLRIGFFLVAVVAMSWFVYAWHQSGRAALLAALLATGCLQVSIAYQPLVSYPTLWLGWACIWAMGAMALSPESARARCAMAVLFAGALAVHEANAVFLFWPAAVRLVAGRSRSWSGEIREFAMTGSVLLAYGVLSVMLRHYAVQVGDLYAGATIRIDPKNIAYALLVFSASGLPAFDSIVDRFTPAGESILLSPGEWVGRLAMANPLDWCAALLLGVAVWLLLPRERVNVSLISAGLLLGIAAVAPNALLALTEKYQIWAHQRMWPYYYTSMSFLAFSALLAVLALRMGNSGFARALLAMAIGGAAIGASAASHHAVDRLRRAPFNHTASPGPAP